MVVEDQALLALDLEMMLTDIGCEVVGTAMDRVSALEIGDRERPDLAFVDINLRDGSTGPLIAHKLAGAYGCAVVFVTANLEQVPDGFASALGAVSKPFDAETIAGVVRFVEIFRRDRRIEAAPPRFRMAPGLLDLPDARG
jgi:DNA-binding LytR/AlgR family response regulator